MQTAIAHQRLLNQRIAGEQCTRPEEVVRWMGAMQAQDYLQALWAIGLRMPSATAAAIEQAIADGKILRTWPMRGTLHFVPPADAKWMLQLSAARVLASDRWRLEQLELDEATIERAKQLFHDALAGGRRLSRPAMMQLLEDAGISTAGQRGYHLLWYIAQTGLICLGPIENKRQTFVLLDEWAPQSRKLSREESLAELARRYITSHGPATVQDFAWWTGLTVTEAKRGFAAAKPECTVEKIEGQEYWIAQDAPSHKASDTSDTSGSYLLPGFDEYLLGYKDRSAVLASEHSLEVVPGKNGIFFPTIVMAGRIAGTWKRSGKKALEILLKPFNQSDELETTVIEAARNYSNFAGLPLSSIVMQASNQAI
ncbi:MAG: AlkZ family DNA glycosylase [Ktedonobacteraceae bacterium]|nr:AlkZ family DNA glycosylase [Ktedonobacteraceae bacterium]